MKSRTFLWILVSTGVFTLQPQLAFSAADSLEDQLQQLNLPSNQAPAGVSEEKIYSMQNRYSPLKMRSEVAFTAGKNLTADDFIVSDEVGLTYRFYLSDRFSLSLAGTYVFNSLSQSGQRLLDMDALFPDVAYVRNRGDLSVAYNLFYGKFRLSMDRVLYFDQYVALGGGVVDLNTGLRGAAVGDVGFVFWLGKSGSVRLGFKDYYFNEIRTLSNSNVNHLVGHLDVGWVFGG